VVEFRERDPRNRGALDRKVVVVTLEVAKRRARWLLDDGQRAARHGLEIVKEEIVLLLVMVELPLELVPLASEVLLQRWAGAIAAAAAATAAAAAAEKCTARAPLQVVGPVVVVVWWRRQAKGCR
jgi:hypothetical protein